MSSFGAASWRPYQMYPVGSLPIDRPSDLQRTRFLHIKPWSSLLKQIQCCNLQEGHTVFYLVTSIHEKSLWVSWVNLSQFLDGKFKVLWIHHPVLTRSDALRFPPNASRSYLSSRLIAPFPAICRPCLSTGVVTPDCYPTNHGMTGAINQSPQQKNANQVLKSSIPLWTSKVKVKQPAIVRLQNQQIQISDPWLRYPNGSLIMIQPQCQCVGSQASQ